MLRLCTCASLMAFGCVTRKRLSLSVYRYCVAVYRCMRLSDPRLIAVQPEDPEHQYTGKEARELQRQMNSLGAQGIQRENAYIAEQEQKRKNGEACSEAEQAEYDRLRTRKQQRSSYGKRKIRDVLITLQCIDEPCMYQHRPHLSHPPCPSAGSSAGVRVTF